MTSYTSPPGYVGWIARNPNLAFPGRQGWAVDLPLLRRVQRDVNASMTYRAEPVDVWGSGSDCEDYAIAKLRRLLAAGVPRGAMRLAACRVDGRGHALLIVGELWVMDSSRRDGHARRSGAQVIRRALLTF